MILESVELRTRFRSEGEKVRRVRRVRKVRRVRRVRRLVG